MDDRGTRFEPQLADTVASGSHALIGSRKKLGAVLAGRFELAAHLGSGGMGSVYLARDRQLDEDVAIKILHEHTAGPVALEMLRREVKLARRITSPHVARIHELVTDGDEWFLTMEFVDGVPLSDMIAGDNKLPIARVVDVLQALCDGLAAVHRAGVVHGDVKPANVLVARDGRVVLSDFGIARFAGHLQDSREIVGTPAYMAPEQVTGDELDPRADLYALGIIAFELLSGELPFSGRNAIEVASARLVRDPPDLGELCPDAPASVVAAVRRLLSRDREDRPASAEATREALSEAPPSEPSIESVDVVDLYLKAQWLYHQFEHVDESVELFERARLQAPRSAIVHAGYAMALTRKWMLDGIDRGDLADRAVAAAEQALELGPQLGETQQANGAIALQLGEPVSAARSYRKALTLAPGLASAHAMVATLLLELGELDEADRRLDIALRLDPAFARIELSVACARGLAGDWSIADRVFAKEIQPSTLEMMMGSRAAAYRGDREMLARLQAIGRSAEPPDHLTASTLYNIMPDIFAGAIDLEQVYPLVPLEAAGMSPRRLSITMQVRAEFAGNAGDHARALEAIEVADRDGALIDVLWIDRCPLLDGLRGAPAFESVCRRVRERAEAVKRVLGR